MRLLFKEKNDASIYGFIFDIFSKYSKDHQINNTQLQEVLLVFGKVGGDALSTEEEQFYE